VASKHRHAPSRSHPRPELAAGLDDEEQPTTARPGSRSLPLGADRAAGRTAPSIPYAPERDRPRRPAPPRLPARPGDAALRRCRSDGRAPPLATNPRIASTRAAASPGPPGLPPPDKPGHAGPRPSGPQESRQSPIAGCHENSCGNGALRMQRYRRLPAETAPARSLGSAKRSRGWAGPDDPHRGKGAAPFRWPGRPKQSCPPAGLTIAIRGPSAAEPQTSRHRDVAKAQARGDDRPRT
jgi:hypothetical protein